MERQEVFQRLIGVLRAECPSALKGLVPTWETKLVDDMGIDSIGLIKFMVGLDDEFGICLENQNIAHVETLGDVAELILGLQRAVDTKAGRFSPTRRIGEFLTALRRGAGPRNHHGAPG